MRERVGRIGRRAIDLANAIGTEIRSLPSRDSVQYLRSRFVYHRDRQSYPGSLADPYKTVRIDPADVEYMRVPHFNMSHSKQGSYVFDGDWDRRHADDPVGYFRLREDPKLARIENYLFYRSVERWATGDREWDRTRCYRVLARSKGTTAAERKGEKLRRLKERIETEGYRTQRDVAGKRTVPDRLAFWRPPPEHHEVKLNVGRDGEWIFDDGKHRFCLARALRVGPIPAKILVRHREWQRVRVAVNAADSPDELGDRARRHLGHPDLADVTGERLREAASRPDSDRTQSPDLDRDGR